jgi:hypothetical protein
VCAQETERGELVLLDLWCVQEILRASNGRKSSPVYRKIEGGRGRAAPGDEEASSWERKAFQEKLP